MKTIGESSLTILAVVVLYRSSCYCHRLAPSRKVHRVVRGTDFKADSNPDGGSYPLSIFKNIDFTSAEVRIRYISETYDRSTRSILGIRNGAIKPFRTRPASFIWLSILHKQLHRHLVEEVLHTFNGLRFSKPCDRSSAHTVHSTLPIHPYTYEAY